MKNIINMLILCGLFLSGETLIAQDVFSQYQKIVFGCFTKEDSSFESFSRRAKESGATHIALNAEDLPIAYWELEPENDPYPAWVITNPGLLKINPPEKLKPYIHEDYGESVMEIIVRRSEILDELGLKGAFHTFEPQMLPIEFLQDYPSLLGPQVDNPMRSRLDRFAPSMSNTEVQWLYTKALKKFKDQCSVLDILEFRTNDSGAGIEWSEALYAGANGNSRYESQTMGDRIHGFLSVLQKGMHKESLISDVHIYNTKEDQKEIIARQLDGGQAIDNMEGPDARQFKYEVGSLLYYRKSFAPARGIPWPVTFLSELEGALENNAERLFVLMGDSYNQELYFDIYNTFREAPTYTLNDRFDLLEDLAIKYVGVEASKYLLNTWLNLYNAEKYSEILSSGGSIFILGCVHQRWLTRPFVPFLDKMTEEEKKYYRKFQFQARADENANDLLDLQGSRFVDGFNGFRLTNRLLSKLNGQIQEARQNLQHLNKIITTEESKKYRLLDTRLLVYQCLIKNVRNAIHYQVVLDRAKLLSQKEKNPPYPYIGPKDYWSRQELMKIARNEIDNTTALIKLIKQNKKDRIIDHADEKHQEYHRLLGADLVNQLDKKIQIMLKYWIDYKEIQIN